MTVSNGENEISVSDVTLIPGAELKAFLWSGTDAADGSMMPLSDTAYLGSGESVASEDVLTVSEVTYKNIPLVSDWITGEKSGLGMGAGIIAPEGAPYGVCLLYTSQQRESFSIYVLNLLPWRFFRKPRQPVPLPRYRKAEYRAPPPGGVFLCAARNTGL